MKIEMKTLISYLVMDTSEGLSVDQHRLETLRNKSATNRILYFINSGSQIWLDLQVMRVHVANDGETLFKQVYPGGYST